MAKEGMAITRKKGETVHMYTFTGMYVGEFTITGATKDAVTIEQKNGRVTKFARENGRQLEANVERCASWITEEPRPPKEKSAKKKVKPGEEQSAAKKASKKKKPEPIPEEEDDFDGDEYEEV